MYLTYKKGHQPKKKKMKNENTQTVTILLLNALPHFSASSSLSYEILSEMFFKCVLRRVSGIHYTRTEVFRGILKVNSCFYFFTQTIVRI